MNEYYYSLLINSLLSDTKKLIFYVKDEDFYLVMKFYKLLKKYQKIIDIKKVG